MNQQVRAPGLKGQAGARRCAVIVLAAGVGRRFKSKVPKAFVPLGGHPVLVYSLRAFQQHQDISEIVVAVRKGSESMVDNIVKKYALSKVRNVVLGGEERQDSVRNALRNIDASTDCVLIHDGVRPFVQQQQITQCLHAAYDTGSAVLGVPVKYTIKRVKELLGRKGTRTPGHKRLLVKETLQRGDLWEIQTPQVFQRQVIVEAYRRFGRTAVTDDAMLVEKLGVNVAVVQGSYSNIKITTVEDLAIAETYVHKGIQS